MTKNKNIYNCNNDLDDFQDRAARFVEDQGCNKSQWRQDKKKNQTRGRDHQLQRGHGAGAPSRVHVRNFLMATYMIVDALGGRRSSTTPAYPGLLLTGRRLPQDTST